MTSSRLPVRYARLFPWSGAFLFGALFFTQDAHAEKTLVQSGDFQVYVDGRVGGFLSYAYGDAFPQPYKEIDATGAPRQIHAATGGGFTGNAELSIREDPAVAPGQEQGLLNQGTINMVRIRSGFIGNVFGFGVRYPVTETTMVSAYLQFWAVVENAAQQKTLRTEPDARQGYGKVEGPWGSVIAGRTRALYSRGATDIDVRFAHKYGVGFPGKIESDGPAAGQLGFGPLGSGFASSIMYGTPKLAGFQLMVAAMDPVILPGGNWIRTKYPRAEGQLTYELEIGDSGKIGLFANGMHQKLYKNSYCPPKSDTNPAPCEETAAGFGYGGTAEFGPVHIGVAGHAGKGLGLAWALDGSAGSINVDTTELRSFDGYYAQTMFSFAPIDVFAGAGISRVFLVDADKIREPSPIDPNTMILAKSVIKNQIGINAGVVYHATDNLHLDLDYFRAEANWYLGEKQVVHVLNSGMTVTW